MTADEGFFGEQVAARYDAHSGGMFDPAVVGPAVERLAELAGDGRALEFAIGTGRIALPLAERGVPVAGRGRPGRRCARFAPAASRRPRRCFSSAGARPGRSGCPLGRSRCLTGACGRSATPG